MKASKNEAREGAIFENGNYTLAHPRTWNLFESMYYSWVIHCLWVILLHESLYSVDWLLFQSSMVSGLGIGSLYLWSSLSQCFQFKSFVIPICSRDVSLCHPFGILFTFWVGHPCVSCAQFIFFTPSTYVHFTFMMGDTSLPSLDIYLPIASNTSSRKLI